MIEIKELSKMIGKNIVLNDVSIVAKEGEATGLSGVNGSGKTMLMRSIAGLIYPDFGVICINGKELHKDFSFPPSIGFLIDSPAFLDAYSGFDNLKMIASIKSLIGVKEIKEIILRVGLDPDSKKKYRKYSLGMKQRLGIAAAIMERPDIILLDEPTNALDSSGIALVNQIILEEKKRGATVILSCHDHAFLAEVSDNIYYLENGQNVKKERMDKSNA